MSRRLMTLRQIQAEKFPLSRSWIYAAIASGRFPRPIGGCVPNLWEESAIDEYVQKFVIESRQRIDAGAQRMAAVRDAQDRQRIAEARDSQRIPEAGERRRVGRRRRRDGKAA